MARIKFTRAGRARPRDKGGQRWLHEKAYRYKDAKGDLRLRPPVFFEHDGTYEVTDAHADLLTRRHPEIFSLVEEKPVKAAKKEPEPKPEPEPESESSMESES